MFNFKNILIESALSAGIGLIVGMAVIVGQHFQKEMLSLLAFSSGIGILVGLLSRTGFALVLIKFRKKPYWAFLTMFILCGGCTVLIAFLAGERNLTRLLFYAVVVEALVMPMSYSIFQYTKLINMQLRKKEDEIRAHSHR